MKIYTKTGDKGETGLFGGSRVPKDHIRIQAYGTLDELNSILGIAMAQLTPADRVLKTLETIQEELFQLGAELATPPNKKVPSALVEQDSIERFEGEIDEFEKSLAPLKTFILPGGTLLSALMHHARTVCRRAEREVVSLSHNETIRPEVLEYLNRLSDYLFVLARYENHVAGVLDRPWIGRKK